MAWFVMGLKLLLKQQISIANGNANKTELKQVCSDVGWRKKPKVE